MRILAIDLGHVFRRQWEAKSEEDLGAPLRSTVALVARLREGFDRVAVCCDGGPSWRKSVLPDYKGNRPPAGAPFYEALRRCEERLAADGCHVFKGPPILAPEPRDREDPCSEGGSLYAEADDVIASLVEWAYQSPEGAIGSIRIVSGDKDLLALVHDGSVDVQRFDMPGDPIWNEADVLAKCGVPPDRVTQWLALGGDLADNFKAFPGWEERDEKDPSGKPVKKPGIGAKTAAQLLARFGGIKGIFDALDGKDADDQPLIKGHVAEVLRRHGMAAADLGMRLATLRADLPIDFSPLLTEKPVAPLAKGPEAFEGGSFGETPEQPALLVPEKPAPLALRPEPVAAMTPARTSINSLAFQPRDLNELWRTSKALFDSRVYAKKFSSPQQIMAVAIDANERGIALAAALRSAYVVEGTVGYAAGAMAGMVKASGLVDYFELVETTWDRAVVEFKFSGGTRRVVRYEATIEDATRKGYASKGVWRSDRKSMLVAMAYRECARQHFPEIMSNTYSPDELRDNAADVAELETV